MTENRCKIGKISWVLTGMFQVLFLKPEPLDFFRLELTSVDSYPDAQMVLIFQKKPFSDTWDLIWFFTLHWGSTKICWTGFTLFLFRTVLLEQRDGNLPKIKNKLRTNWGWISKQCFLFKNAFCLKMCHETHFAALGRGGYSLWRSANLIPVTKKKNYLYGTKVLTFCGF